MPAAGSFALFDKVVDLVRVGRLEGRGGAWCLQPCEGYTAQTRFSKPRPHNPNTNRWPCRS
ncbi:hypothetical protein GCM10010335_69690 [Streptomyces galbus]|nr:hypothetical protein GCM10010335_69690 [Streptomyces galbus]